MLILELLAYMVVLLKGLKFATLKEVLVLIFCVVCLAVHKYVDLADENNNIILLYGRCGDCYCYTRPTDRYVGSSTHKLAKSDLSCVR